MKEKLFITTLLIQALLITQTRTEYPTNYGYFLSKDVTAAKVKRLFRIPTMPWYSVDGVYGATANKYAGNGMGIVSRAVEVNELGIAKTGYGTTGRSLSLKSFPEVHRVYSFRQQGNIQNNENALGAGYTTNGNWRTSNAPGNPYYEDRTTNRGYTFAKDTTGKWGAWRFRPEINRFGLEPESIYYQSNLGYSLTNVPPLERDGAMPDVSSTNFNRGAVRAQYNSTTGDCSHDVRYIAPYIVFACLNKVSFNDRFTATQVYDYYILTQENNGNDKTDWWMSPQNWLNYSRALAPDGTTVLTSGTYNPTKIRVDAAQWIRDINFNQRIRIGRAVLTGTGTYGAADTSNNAGNKKFALFWNGPFEGQLSSQDRLPNRAVNKYTNIGETNEANTVEIPILNDPSYFFVRRVENGATSNKKNFQGLHAFNNHILCQLDLTGVAGGGNVGAILEMVQLKGSPNMMVTILNRGNTANGNEKVQILECTWNAGKLDILFDGNAYATPAYTKRADICLNGCVPVVVDTTDTASTGLGLLNGAAGGTGNFRLGSMKYVASATTGNGYIVGINQDVADTDLGTDRFTRKRGNVWRCSYASAQTATPRVMNNCAQSPQCPGPKNSFGYFSDCVTSESCGIYYMGRSELNSYIRKFSSTGANLDANSDTLYIDNLKYNAWKRLNRVYCADIIKFPDDTTTTGVLKSPLLYTRHFTGEGVASAHDIAQVISVGVDSTVSSLTIESNEEVYIYNQELPDPTDAIIPVWTPTTQTACTATSTFTNGLYPLALSSYDYQLATTARADQNSLCIYGRVVRIGDIYPPEGVYPMHLYTNMSSVMPFGREQWRVNNPTASITGASLNSKTWETLTYHVNRLQVTNTEDGVSFYDQVPMNGYIVRVRRGVRSTNSRDLEVARCWNKYNKTVTTTCTGSNDTAGIGRRIALQDDENIKRAWYFNQSIVVLTQQGYAFSFNNASKNPGYTPKTGNVFPYSKDTYTNGIPRHRLYSYIKKTGVWSMHDFGAYTDTTMNGATVSNGRTTANLNQGLIEHIDVAEHECDLIIAYKLWTDLYVTRPIVVVIAPNKYLADSANPTVGTNTTWWNLQVKRKFPEYEYYPKDHPTGINSNQGYTSRRFFPLEDDSCVTGLNIVQDVSWRVRFLMDCTRNDNDPVHQVWGKTKWFGDYFIYDNSYVRKYKNIFNVTGSRYSRGKDAADLDVFGDQLEYGCANRQYVFVYTKNYTNASQITTVDTNITALVAGVHVATKSKVYFDLYQFGVGSIQDMWCVGDYVVGYGTARNGATSGNLLFVLFGTNINDARRRVHSVTPMQRNITRISPVLVDNKIWVSFADNNAMHGRVIFTDGPIVVLNSTTVTNNAMTLSQTNSNPQAGATTLNNVPITPNFVTWATKAKLFNDSSLIFPTTTKNINGLNVLEGPVYNIEARGRNVDTITVKQRIRWLKEQAAYPNWNDPLLTWQGKEITTTPFLTGTYGPRPGDLVNNNWGDPQLSDTRSTIAELKIKGTRLIELLYDRGYSRLLYNDLVGDGTDTFRLTYPIGLECKLLDFDVNAATTTANTNANLFYWASVCQQSQYKEVRIQRETHTLPSNAALTASSASGVIIPNDQIDKLSLDRIVDNVYLLSLFNKDEKILNISVYNVNTALNGNNNQVWYENRIGAPMQTYMKTNGKNNSNYRRI